MRVCTYNVLGFQGWPPEAAAKTLGDDDDPKRLASFTAALEQLQSDIIGIQEGGSFLWMQRVADALGRYVAVFPTRVAYPGAIISVYPIVEQRNFTYGPPADDVPFTRTAGAALLQIGDNHLWAVNIHAHPKDEDMRAAEAEVLKNHLAPLIASGHPVIVLGDYNSVPDTSIHNMLHELGFADTMSLTKTEIRPTMNAVDGGLRRRAIDHIYVDKLLQPTVQASRLYLEPGYYSDEPTNDTDWLHSDHVPVVADFDWPPAAGNKN